MIGRGDPLSSKLMMFALIMELTWGMIFSDFGVELDIGIIVFYLGILLLHLYFIYLTKLCNHLSHKQPDKDFYLPTSFYINADVDLDQHFLHIHLIIQYVSDRHLEQQVWGRTLLRCLHGNFHLVSTLLLSYNPSIQHCWKGCDYGTGRVNEVEGRDEATRMCKRYTSEAMWTRTGELESIKDLRVHSDMFPTTPSNIYRACLAGIRRQRYWADSDDKKWWQWALIIGNSGELRILPHSCHRGERLQISWSIFEGFRPAP